MCAIFRERRPASKAPVEAAGAGVKNVSSFRRAKASQNRPFDARAISPHPTVCRRACTTLANATNADGGSCSARVRGSTPAR